MAANQDAQDLQDYQDYQAYQARSMGPPAPLSTQSGVRDMFDKQSQSFGFADNKDQLDQMSNRMAQGLMANQAIRGLLKGFTGGGAQPAAPAASPAAELEPSPQLEQAPQEPGWRVDNDGPIKNLPRPDQPLLKQVPVEQAPGLLKQAPVGPSAPAEPIEVNDSGYPMEIERGVTPKTQPASAPAGEHATPLWKKVAGVGLLAEGGHEIMAHKKEIMEKVAGGLAGMVPDNIANKMVQSLSDDELNSLYAAQQKGQK